MVFIQLYTFTVTAYTSTYMGYMQDTMLMKHNVLHRGPTIFFFTDCQHDYRDNKSLYAMYDALSF